MCAFFATYIATSAFCIIDVTSSAWSGRTARPRLASTCRSSPSSSGRELAAILPLAVFVLWVGLYPKPFLNIIDASVKHLLEQVHGKESGR